MKIRLVQRDPDFPCAYDVHRNGSYIGYIVPTLWGFEFTCTCGFTYLAASMKSILKAVTYHGQY